MNLAKLALLLFIAGIFSACSKNDQTAEKKFHGMWSLDKYETLVASGKWIPDTAFIGATGHIMYDGKGHMGVQINRKGYKDFDVSKNIDSLDMKNLKDLAKLYRSNFTYMAEYKITGTNTIEHKKFSATNPMDWGTTVTREFEFKGDTLILTPKEMVNGNKDRLIWIKN
jgi:hypothetical protein